MKREQKKRGTFMFVGLLITVAIHGGVFGFVWFTRARAEAKKSDSIGTFVDAQLVRFGKPRDLKFLPHKEGVVKDKPEGIKVAKSMDALPRLKDDKPQPEVDPLKKTRAEMFKNLKDPDQPEGMQETGIGSPTGSRAGTAEEAKGDPYILSLIDTIGSGWNVPKTIEAGRLAKMSAEVCLTINESGALTGYEFTRKGDEGGPFDSSLDARLSTIRTVPPPPDKWKSAARKGRLCPTFFPPGI